MFPYLSFCVKLISTEIHVSSLNEGRIRRGEKKKRRRVEGGEGEGKTRGKRSYG